MAQFPLTDVPWRMLRLALKKTPFRFEDVRFMRRTDRKVFDWLLANGFFEAVGEGTYRVSPKGLDAADLGMYEWRPTPSAAAPPAPPRAKGKRK